MARGARAPSSAKLTWRWKTPAPARWREAWSRPAAVRAIRAAVVMPGLFALADQVIGNRQLATYAAFGAFATLILAGFGGSTRDKLTAHAGLAVAGSVLVIVGTAASSAMRLRLTANGIARMPRGAGHGEHAGAIAIERRAQLLAGLYEQLGAFLGRPRGRPSAPVAAPAFPDDALVSSKTSAVAIWLREHLEHLRSHLTELVEPARSLAEIRSRPWWR